MTAPLPTGLNAAVRTVLAGVDPADAAARHALGPVDLDDAVRTYQAAGFAAVERRADDAWYQVRIQFTDWSAAETIGATTLGPALDWLCADEAVAGW
ncbi:hypothetical protein VA596_47170 [Amycolatopsis sp., V23-08]|uniref:Uncharacterized protein n=1 Tax=Amycolatopsis heterodermiae TaxID=3110235 RepID=A0ABU5RNY5_9PSEU|nr:hypothetical protein [Amycolatopsis sp., V23-08]MEA5367180.1 hypothetical protein [Amycolatopsis sp., V23-08]